MKRKEFVGTGHNYFNKYVTFFNNHSFIFMKGVKDG